MDAKAWAHSLVADFRKRNKGGLWLHFNSNTVADELDKRIDNPELIHQNNTEFCAYASLAYSVASRYPESYVWFVICLFEDGIGWFGVTGGQKAKIVASSKVRTQRLPRMSDGTPMAQADWIALASMREHFNSVLFDIGEGIPIIGPLVKALHSGTTSGEVAGALKQLGCTEVYDQSSTHSPRDMGFAMAADGHWSAGRLVMLFIDADLLDADKRTTSPGPLSRGNHWVALNSRLTLSPDKQWIHFQVFSWGELMGVPDNDGTFMPVSDFQKRFYGYVVGKF
jgi:hypothetical protein